MLFVCREWLELAMRFILPLTLLFCFSTTSATSVHQPNVINRLNYGIIFNPVKPILFQAENAKLAFIVEIPVIQPQPLRQYTCQDIRDRIQVSNHSVNVHHQPMCGELTNYLNLFQQIEHKTFDAVAKQISQIRDTVSNFDIRSRRGLFPALGHFISGITSLAHTDDIQHIKNRSLSASKHSSYVQSTHGQLVPTHT